MTNGTSPAQTPAVKRRPRGVVRERLVQAGLEMARVGGPDAVVLREATRAVGVVPNAAYRHFADRDALLAAVCGAAMDQLSDRMAEDVGRVRGEYGDPAAAGRRLRAVGAAYLRFAHEEPGLFATAYALPDAHSYGEVSRPDAGAGPDADAGPGPGPDADRSPRGQLRAALDELVDAGVLSPERRVDVEYPVWSAVHGLAVLTGQGPLREVSDRDRSRLEEAVLRFIGDGLAGGPS